MAARVGPLRPMALVVVTIATLFVATLTLIQLDTRNASGAVTLPLIVLVPVVFGLLYWRYRR